MVYGLTMLNTGSVYLMQNASINLSTLHIKYANDYWDKIPLKIWGSLYQKVLEQQYIIQDVILKAKKKKPKKDLECIEILKKCLER